MPCIARSDPAPPLPVPVQVPEHRGAGSSAHSHWQGPSSAVGAHETLKLCLVDLPFSVQCTSTSPSLSEGKTSTRSVLRSQEVQGSDTSQLPDLPLLDSAHCRSDWTRYSSMAPGDSSPTCQV